MAHSDDHFVGVFMLLFVDEIITSKLSLVKNACCKIRFYYLHFPSKKYHNYIN